MSRLRIQGGKKLHGSLRVSGMKNAATPLLAAALLTEETCILHRVPRIRDVDRMTDLLRSLGAEVEWIDEHDLRIRAAELDLKGLDRKAMRTMRSSILLLGPLLARFREADLPEPGGCIIGNRPVDTHLAALKGLGVEVEPDDRSYHFRTDGMKGARIVLPEFSVTATENLMMAAALADGETVIMTAAAEPHVQDLGDFLNAMGARVSGHGTHTVRIRGVERLGGAEHAVIPDQIEAGTFLVAAALSKGRLRVEGIRTDHLDLVIRKLRDVGVEVETGEDWVEATASATPKAFKWQSLPYPGLPTDLMAPFGLLATQCRGTSLVHEPLYEGRFGFIGELVKMGANAVVCDPHRVLVTGPTPLYGREIRSLDLRAGATLLLAGMVAEGETVIHEAENIDRGYEDIDTRLRALGADIVREADAQ